MADAHQLEAVSLERDLISLTTATLDKSQEELAANEGVAKEIWLDFEDFCVCFHHIYVFHKPGSYCLNFQKSEFKFMEERVPYYLFVDSLKPIELLVCFSALVRWGESGGKRVLRVGSSGCPEHRWAQEHVTITLVQNVGEESELPRTALPLPLLFLLLHTGDCDDSCPLILSWSQSLVHLYGMFSLTFLFISTGSHLPFLCYLIGR